MTTKTRTPVPASDRVDDILRRMESVEKELRKVRPVLEADKTFMKYSELLLEREELTKDLKEPAREKSVVDQTVCLHESSLLKVLVIGHKRPILLNYRSVAATVGALVLDGLRLKVIDPAAWAQFKAHTGEFAHYQRCTAKFTAQVESEGEPATPTVKVTYPWRTAGA